jgi:hypothetical protein
VFDFVVVHPLPPPQRDKTRKKHACNDHAAHMRERCFSHLLGMANLKVTPLVAIGKHHCIPISYCLADCRRFLACQPPPRSINIQDTSPITAYGLGTWTGGRATPKGEAATCVPA